MVRLKAWFGRRGSIFNLSQERKYYKNTPSIFQEYDYDKGRLIALNLELRNNKFKFLTMTAISLLKSSPCKWLSIRIKSCTRNIAVSSICGFLKDRLLILIIVLKFEAYKQCQII